MDLKRSNILNIITIIIIIWLVIAGNCDINIPQVKCRDEYDGHLVHIDNQAENDWLASECRTYNSRLRCTIS